MTDYATVLPPSPSADPVIAIVVVNFGSHRLLEHNLGARADARLPIRVVVVDNYFSDDERARLSDLARRRGWDMVALPENRGFGGAVNAGVEQAVAFGCQCVLLLNPDAVATSETIMQLREHVLEHPNDLVCPRVLTSAGSVEFRGSRLSLRDGRIKGLADGGNPAASDGSVDWLTGACLAVHVSLFQQLAGFVEDYFLYWEDVDLSFRATRLGARLVVRHDLTVVHDEGGTQAPTRGRAKSDLYYYYNTRNRLLFASRNLGRRELVGWVFRTPAVSWEILMRGGRRQLVHSRRPLLAATRGSLAGLLVALRVLISRRAWPR